MFELKEDIRVYSDETDTELLFIRARQILDFSAAYDSVDSQMGTKSGFSAVKASSRCSRMNGRFGSNDHPLVSCAKTLVVRSLLRRFLLGSFRLRINDLLIGDARVADRRQASTFAL